jgi:hypothetical protein
MNEFWNECAVAWCCAWFFCDSEVLHDFSLNVVMMCSCFRSGFMLELSFSGFGLPFLRIQLCVPAKKDQGLFAYPARLSRHTIALTWHHNILIQKKHTYSVEMTGYSLLQRVLPMFAGGVRRQAVFVFRVTSNNSNQNAPHSVLKTKSSSI